MDTHIVKISYLPRHTTGLRLSATVASVGVSAEQVARAWAHKNAIEVETWSVVDSLTVPQDGTVVDVL